jgi:hypothetical protein
MAGRVDKRQLKGHDCRQQGVLRVGITETTISVVLSSFFKIIEWTPFYFCVKAVRKHINASLKKKEAFF